MARTRAEIIAEAERIGQEISEYFDDVAHYNNVALEAGNPTIDPDPDGMLTSIAASIDKMLETGGAA